ncbi:endonuclease domain-containing 1 protein-like, partial [Oryzias latipes]
MWFVHRECEKMLLFLLLVFLPVVPIETEVVRTLADCPGFFVEDTPPVIPNILEGGSILNQNRYKVICQTFENKRRFLTLYDTTNKIPVFSAYRFTGAAETGRPKDRDIWKIEPQLDEDKNMRKLEDSNQALNSDYVNNQGYNRGHLYPNCHAQDWNDKLSTFTLTNVVPQSIPFNSGSWAQMERCTKCFMENNCINTNGRIEAFVVAGAEPGETKLNNKINIPSRMWSAFCCYNSRDGVWLSKAYWGHNQPNMCDLDERSCKDIKDSFGIQIFPESLCSSKKDVKPPKKLISRRTIFCSKSPCECLLENSTTTAPPTTKDQTSETPTTVITTQKMTTTLPTTTKTTQTTTSTTTRSTKSTTKKKKDKEKENKGRNPGNDGGGGGGGGGG